MISASGLAKTFNAGTASEKIAIAGLDLEVAAGQFVAVIGGNGAGKSTLLNLLSGALSADRGRIVIDGSDVTAMAEHRRAALVARVFQDPMIGTAPSLTIEENMALALMRTRSRGLRAALGRERRETFRAALATLGLGLEGRLEARADTLSGGQRQALALVMATLVPPRLLLLDEHTAALDPGTSQLVMEATVALVRDRGLTTLMVTHNMQHALDYAGRIVMMDRGRIVADLGGEEIAGLTVGALVERFRLNDDRIVLSRGVH